LRRVRVFEWALHYYLQPRRIFLELAKGILIHGAARGQQVDARMGNCDALESGSVVRVLARIKLRITCSGLSNDCCAPTGVTIASAAATAMTLVNL
jgi:hypothetical protein